MSANRKNKTEFALLGLLSLRPMSGYDMRSFMSKSIGFFWQESYGQIYPTQRVLLNEHLVTRKGEKKKKSRNRFIYTITRSGKAKLIEWLSQPSDNEPVRLEFLLKIFFGANASPSLQSAQLELYQESQKNRLKSLQGVKKGILREYENDHNYRYWLSTLRYGILITRARIQWCKETATRLEDNTDTSSN